MKRALILTSLLILLGAYGFSQESLIEIHQKMIEEIQNDFNNFLLEISGPETNVGTEKSKGNHVEVNPATLVTTESSINIPNIYPTEKRPSISSPYGYRKDPFGRGIVFHKGIDIPLNVDTDILCTAAGKVKKTGYNRTGGKYIIINHDSGYQTYYGHLSSYKVKEGEIVKKGQVIAKSGNTGMSTGPHLHYTVLSGEKTINPLTLINSHLKQINYESKNVIISCSPSNNDDGLESSSGWQ